MFNPQTSLLAGRSVQQLQADLAKAQQAYIDLTAGDKGVAFSYAQGDGSKGVTYTAANLPALQALIRQLQQQLGIVPQARRPARFRF
jgi:hypothetical protein